MQIRLLGVKIKFDFLFFAFISLILLLDKSGMTLPLLLAILAHEIAHLVCMKILNCQPKEFYLAVSGIEIIREFCLNPKKEILISFSGPLINSILFLIFLKIDLEFALINLFISAYNLLPIKNLDGGEILMIILSEKIGKEKAVRILNFLNLLFGVFGVLLSVFFVINGKINFSLIIFSVYLILSFLIKF